MPAIIIPKGWEIPEREATSEAAYFNRRKFLKAAGLTGLGTVGLLSGCGSQRVFEPFNSTPGAGGSTSGGGSSPPGGGTSTSGGGTSTSSGPLYPATRDPEFSELDRPLTQESVATSYNNFYEFSEGKTDVLKMASQFVTEPWKVEVAGLVQKPTTFDFDDLVRKFPLEERLYRHRCVEAWSIAVPWTGFPMKALMDLVQPLSAAKFVKMTTFLNPGEAPGQFANPQWPWPYVEGLTIDEAANALTFLVTGIYGHALPKQNGAPLRLAVPWKYGFKSIKSIVKIEFTSNQPATFWHTLVPSEYGFQANVDPSVPHPRWSQATEKFITTSIVDVQVRPTLLYNGYGSFVADLYSGNGPLSQAVPG